MHVAETLRDAGTEVAFLLNSALQVIIANLCGVG